MTPLQSCRTCRHLLVRHVSPPPTRKEGASKNYYCVREDDVADLWRLEHKPNRRLPFVGARDCPGHEREPTQALAKLMPAFYTAKIEGDLPMINSLRDQISAVITCTCVNAPADRFKVGAGYLLCQVCGKQPWTLA